MLGVWISSPSEVFISKPHRLARANRRHARRGKHGFDFAMDRWERSSRWWRAKQ
jgi:hypothetical protein